MTHPYTCYNEWCRTHHACDCGSKCCNGFYTPLIMRVISSDELEFSDDDGKTWQKDEVHPCEIKNLVYFNECPHCGHYTEC
jgi:hypothetical protein